MSSFGTWYDNVKNEGEEGDSSESGMGMTLPLFNTPAGIPADFGWNSVKAGLEAQMPQQILGMNYQQRFQVFCALLILSGVFFGLGFIVGLPTITFRPQKFALSFTCGSLTFMGSFAILRGPQAHLAGMLTPDRLPFTAVYLLSMFMTLYFTFTAHGAKGYISVLTASGLQLLALLWYLVTFLPGGAQGMKVLVSAILTMLRPIIVGCTKCCSGLLMRFVGGVGSSWRLATAKHSRSQWSEEMEIKCSWSLETLFSVAWERTTRSNPRCMSMLIWSVKPRLLAILLELHGHAPFQMWWLGLIHYFFISGRATGTRYEVARYCPH